MVGKHCPGFTRYVLDARSPTCSAVSCYTKVSKLQHCVLGYSNHWSLRVNRQLYDIAAFVLPVRGALRSGTLAELYITPSSFVCVGGWFPFLSAFLQWVSGWSFRRTTDLSFTECVGNKLLWKMSAHPGIDFCKGLLGPCGGELRRRNLIYSQLSNHRLYWLLVQLEI